MRTEAFRSC